MRNIQLSAYYFANSDLREVVKAVLELRGKFKQGRLLTLNMRPLQDRDLYGRTVFVCECNMPQYAWYLFSDTKSDYERILGRTNKRQ